MAGKGKYTKLAYRLHGWLGLTAGLFFLLFGLTGSLLMFRGELDRYFNRELHQLTPQGNRLGADSLYRLIAATHPNQQKIVLHDFPRDRFDSYEFMLYRNQEHLTDNYLYFIFINPYNGHILKEGSYGDLSPSFFRWLYSFHYSFQLGLPGKLFAGMLGLLMLVSLLTGLVIYRKHLWNAFRFKGLNFKNRRTTLSSLHRVIGVWATLSTAVLFFTGLWMSLSHLSPAKWALTAPHDNVVLKPNIDQIILRARQIVPGFQPIAMNIPCLNGQPILVRGKMPQTTFALFKGKASSIAFDPVTSRYQNITAIDQADFGKQLDTASYNLHIGSFGGLGIKLLYVVFGLLPGFLSVSGALLWFKKTGKHLASKRTASNKTQSFLPVPALKSMG